MVKIMNIYGDEYRGKQKHAVYQKRYGKQIRRLKEKHKRNDSPAQREQQRRFKVGLSWYKSLSYEEKEGLKLFLSERGISLTPQQYAIKTALDRGKVSKEVFEEQVRTWVYKEGWDLEGWPYRQEITLTNNNSEDLTDYQVKLELNSSNVGENFDWSRKGADLRFYDESGNKLAYYIESWDEINRTAVVWVKVGLIPAGGTTNIYMYYGKEDAVSESDPTAVFDFYDDFEGDSLDTSKWTVRSGTSYYVQNSELHITNRDTHIASVQSFTIPHVFEAKMRAISVNKQLGLELGDNQDHSNIVLFFLITGYEDMYIDANGDGSYEVVEDLFTDTAGDTYNPVSITVTGSKIVLDFVRNGQRTTKTYNYGWTADTYIGLGGYKTGEVSATGNEIAVDWVRVRKYAEQEPTAEFSSEEYGLTEGWATVQVEHIIVEHSGMQRVIILDENGEVIKEYTGLSDIAAGDIATRLDFKNDTGKTVRTVLIESISGVLNKWEL